MKRRTNKRTDMYRRKTETKRGGGDYKTDSDYKKDGVYKKDEYRGGKRRTNKRESRRRRR